jgi:TolA-binding protein
MQEGGKNAEILPAINHKERPSLLMLGASGDAMPLVLPGKWLSSKRATGLFGALSLAAVLTAGGLRAQPVTDQFVSNASVTATKDCSLLRINFNVRVRYTGHAPQDRGDQLRISLQLIDGNTSGDGRLTPREGVRVANADAAGIQSVVLALDESIGPVLHIQFARPTAYQIVQSGSFDSINVAISKNGNAAGCGGSSAAGKRSDQNDKKLGDIPAGTGVSVREKPVAVGKLSEADSKIVDASMDEARDAIKKGNYAAAVDLLKKVLKYPENKSSAEAQELLGVTRLKSGQREEARAEFENYLRRYPTGEGSERVRQRLAGILTAPGAARDKLHGGLDIAAGGPKYLGPKGETRWTYSASVSALYITDDSTSTVKDISTAADPNADPDAHRAHLNTLLTNYDMFGTADNDQMKAKFKLAVTGEHQLGSGHDAIGVSTAMVDYTLKEYDLTARIGRQSRNTGGVLGRFDGAVVSWEQSPGLRWNVLAGSPNWSRFDAPFAYGKTMYGASVDFGKVFGVLDTTLFAIQQFDQSLVDRQGIGAEFRYFDQNKSALGTIDYDVHFQQLNAAIFSGTYTLEDKSVLNAALDYRKVPYLSSWNALQGQPFLTLYDMLRFNNGQDIKQLAIDRTPTFESAMLSYSRPLNATYQIGGDVTVTNLTGTVPSGGVDGTLASGREYYLSTQLTGSGVFTPGDLFMGALRYASLADSNVYVIDINTRYPVTPSLGVSPRLRLGYRTGIGNDLREITILPSFLVSYLWAKDLSFEAEIGTKYLDTHLAGLNSTTKDIFGTLTVRRDFNLDGVSRCHGSVVSCAWAMPAVMQNAGSTATPAMAQKAPPPVFPAFAIEGGLRYWFSTARNRYYYYADLTPSMLVSRLSYTGLTAHAGEAFFRIDAREGPLTNMFVKGYVGVGRTTSGKLYDEDFAPFIDPYSKTGSDANGRLQYASIDVGYNLFEVERFRFGAFLGYHRWLETVDASGCSQVGGNPFICAPALLSSLKVITEEDTWNTLRAGFSANGKVTDRLSWQADFAYTRTSQQALDTHYFTFGSDPATGHGSGFQAETLLCYQLAERFNVGIGGRWWHFSTNAVDSFNQLLQYTTDRYGVFLQGSYKLN